jgi:hypothetical protein
MLDGNMVLRIELVIGGSFCDGPVGCYISRPLVDSRGACRLAWLDHRPRSSRGGAVMPRSWQAGCNGVSGVIGIMAMVYPGSGMEQRRLRFMTCMKQNGLCMRMCWWWDWGQLLGMIRVWWVYRGDGGLC